jgi:hypothetical protein
VCARRKADAPQTSATASDLSLLRDLRRIISCQDKCSNSTGHDLAQQRRNGRCGVPVAKLPRAAPQLLSYALNRWENNIRVATILGVVGFGGLGQLLYFHLSLFHFQQVATVLGAMLLLVGRS